MQISLIAKMRSGLINVITTVNPVKYLTMTILLTLFRKIMVKKTRAKTLTMMVIKLPAQFSHTDAKRAFEIWIQFIEQN